MRSIIPEATENAKKLVEGKTKEEIKEDFCAVNQDTKSQMVDKQVVLLDLKDVGLSAMKCLYVFKIVNSTASHNYPELSKAIYVLNAPTAFDYLYAAVKPFLAVNIFIRRSSQTERERETHEKKKRKREIRERHFN